MNEVICGYKLDNEQLKVVLSNDKYSILIAGAGSGKTFTILGKILYLVKYLKYNQNSILCLSFTNEACKSLEKKINNELNYDIEVLTFHKLAIKILGNPNTFEIADTNLLSDIINEYLHVDALENNKYKLIGKYFKLYFSSTEDYLIFINANEKLVNSFEKLLKTFISLFKCNGLELKDFTKLIKNNFNIFTYFSDKIFLTIAINVYLKYTYYLKSNNEVDFDDLIIDSTKSIDKCNFISKYKFIIIDEYQDTSFIRFNLIREIIKHTDSKLLVVGDDYQSIYRFNGCDINLFTKFNDYFKNATIYKLEKTYRNSEELTKIAKDFIMKNKNQIQKNLISQKHITNPVIIIKYNNIINAFIHALKLISKTNKKDILVLGRNNHDIYRIFDKNLFKLTDNILEYKENNELVIKYLTIHKSKGLESENVILINFENSLNGFPNQIKNDNVLRFVSNNYDYFPYSEERRLFYVALTRTKNKVFILTPYKNPSIFLRDIKKNCIILND